jgi:hypothetical protein
MADLERVLQQLHDSEINAGVQTFYDTGMQVWIGDETNGIQSETTIDRSGNFGRAQTGAPAPNEPCLAAPLHQVCSFSHEAEVDGGSARPDSHQFQAASNEPDR